MQGTGVKIFVCFPTLSSKQCVLQNSGSIKGLNKVNNVHDALSRDGK